MSNYKSNKAEEMRRKNILKFLEGLFDEDNRDGCENNNYAHSASSENLSLVENPYMMERKMSPLRYLSESELSAYKQYPGLLESNKENILKIPFSIHNIKHSDTLVKMYTGIPVAKGFFNLANRFTKTGIKYHKGWVVSQLTLKQQLLMVLMKLKLGMDDVHLSHRFKCSLETVTNTVLTWLFELHQKLFHVIVNNFLVQWSFKQPTMIDTVTVHMKGPTNLHIPHKAPLEPYKALIVAKTDGVVLHAGDLYAWISEKVDIIEESDFFQNLQPGNVVALDSDVCGFLDVPDGVFTFSFDVGCPDVMATRIDLERRLKEYDAFRCIPLELEEHANKVWQVVVALINFSRFKVFTS